MMNPSQPPLAPVCCLCQTVFQEPKVLPCLHTFCLSCLRTLAGEEGTNEETTEISSPAGDQAREITSPAGDQAREITSPEGEQAREITAGDKTRETNNAKSEQAREVTCPTCGCFVTLPPSGVSGLKTNVFVKRIANLYFEEIKKNLHNENAYPDEGFADHSDALLSSGSMPRSETWHGDPSERTVSTIVPSKSVNGDVTLTSLSGTSEAEAEAIVDPADVKAEEPKAEVQENTEDDRARVETKKEACVVTGKLITKLMNIQGEALRITYAIDSVNETVNHWREQNSEIKAKIQERSSMLQHLIKRHEQKLLAEVDNVESYEQFLNEADRAKSELRGNLKRVLNAVQFLKQIQNFANDEEILEMKDFLLGDLKILTTVETIQKEYTLQMPPVSIYDNLDDEFGSLSSVEKKLSVFEPDDGTTGGMKLSQLEKVKQMEFANLSSSKMRKRRAKTQQIRFSSPQGREVNRRATRIITSEDRDLERLSPVKSSSPEDERTDVSNLQETLRQRRREFLEEKHVEEDLSNIHDVQLLSVHRRPARDKKRRVQSFGGRASSRTRHMEEAAKEIKARNEHSKGHLAKLDKTGSLDSADVGVGLTQDTDGKPQAGDDISRKIKYLRENWRRRREILRSSESSRDDHGTGDLSPTSPKSPDNKGQSQFQMLHDQISSIHQHFSPGESNPSPNHSPVHKAHGSNRHSTGSTSEAEQHLFGDKQNGSTGKLEVEEQVFTGSASSSIEHLPEASGGGLTRTKLAEIRANARQKKERWRSQTLS